LKPSIKRARKNGPLKPRKEVEDREANPLILQKDFQEEKIETKRPCKDLTKEVKSRTCMKTLLPTMILSPVTTNIEI
jgi:hypothetical protein